MAELRRQAQAPAGTVRRVGLRNVVRVAVAPEDEAARGHTDGLSERLDELHRLLLEGQEALHGWRGRQG